MNSGNQKPHSGLSSLSKKSDDVAEYYDNWSGDYDETLAQWQYEAPEQVASMLLTELTPASTILDAGCGTGLSGRALRSAGFKKIDGIDVSRRSLDVAGKSDAYRNLREVDMQQLPFPIESDPYDGLACVGVLTYHEDSIGTLREFARVVRPGGILVITQRSDLFVERKFEDVLEILSNEGVFDRVHISEPQSYLPENEEFGDKILVHYITCKVA
jgi:predicted TPR repeat methyltransferase